MSEKEPAVDPISENSEVESQNEAEQPEENIVQKKKDARGIQQLSLKEYEALRKDVSRKRKKKIKAPKALRMVLAIPIGIFGLCGIFIILFLGYRLFFE